MLQTTLSTRLHSLEPSPLQIPLGQPAETPQHPLHPHVMRLCGVPSHTLRVPSTRPRGKGDRLPGAWPRLHSCTPATSRWRPGWVYRVVEHVCTLRATTQPYQRQLGHGSNSVGQSYHQRPHPAAPLTSYRQMLQRRKHAWQCVVGKLHKGTSMLSMERPVQAGEVGHGCADGGERIQPLYGELLGGRRGVLVGGWHWYCNSMCGLQTGQHHEQELRTRAQNKSADVCAI